MTLRREGYPFVAEWSASVGEGAQWRRVGGPVGHLGIAPLFRSKIPLLLGSNANLRANPSPLELDEVRLYDRALSRAELAALVPAELAREERHR